MGKQNGPMGQKRKCKSSKYWTKLGIRAWSKVMISKEKEQNKNWSIIKKQRKNQNGARNEWASEEWNGHYYALLCFSVHKFEKTKGTKACPSPTPSFWHIHTPLIHNFISYQPKNKLIKLVLKLFYSVILSFSFERITSMSVPQGTHTHTGNPKANDWPEEREREYVFLGLRK